MMTSEKVNEIMQKPKSTGEISRALEAQKYHRLHLSGDGYKQWWLKQAKGIESDNSFLLKKELAAPTTPRLTDDIKKQLYKIFRAQGTVKEYKWDGEDRSAELEELLSDVCEGVSLHSFMRTVWFDNMFEDFNGVIGVELEPEDEMESDTEARPYVKFYPTSHIKDIDCELGYIEWIILSHGENKIRVIDEDTDTIYVNDGGKWVQSTDEPQIPNPWGYVPFIQVSQLRDNAKSNFLKRSPISRVIPNLNSFQRLSDDHALMTKIHGHPIFYSYPVTCPTCNGSKLEKYYTEDASGHKEQFERACMTCNSTGVVPHWKRDISQGITLPITENMERDGFPAAAPPAGYVGISVEAFDKQIEGMDREEAAVEQGALGTRGMIESRTRQRTATEMEIDLQPLLDRLSILSHNAEVVEMFIVDAIGKVVFGDRYEGCYIHYGRKYYLRSEEYVMKEYEVSKTGGAPETYLKELLTELYHVRFENNPQALVRALILMDLEPYPTRNSMDELTMVASYASRSTIVLKVNFNDFIERFEEENGPIIAYGAEKDYGKRIAEIRKQLLKYAEEITTTTPTGSPNGDPAEV